MSISKTSTWLFRETLRSSWLYKAQFPAWNVPLLVCVSRVTLSYSAVTQRLWTQKQCECVQWTVPNPWAAGHLLRKVSCHRNAWFGWKIREWVLRPPTAEYLLPASELVGRGCGFWWKAKQKFHLIDWLNMFFMSFSKQKGWFQCTWSKGKIKKIYISLPRPTEFHPVVWIWKCYAVQNKINNRNVYSDSSQTKTLQQVSNSLHFIHHTFCFAPLLPWKKIQKISLQKIQKKKIQKRYRNLIKRGEEIIPPGFLVPCLPCLIVRRLFEV